MASNVIDLISSSPPRLSSSRQSPPVPPTLGKGDAPTHGSGVSRIANAEIDFYSDDFCSSQGENWRSFSPADNRCAKKPRLSADADAVPITQPLATDSAIEPLLSNEQKRPLVRDDDAIEIESTDSSEAEKAYNSPRQKIDSLKEGRATSVMPCNNLVQDYDPFVSSPPKIAFTKPKQSRIVSHILSDSIASSSPDKATSVVTRCTSGNAFAEGPLEPAPRVKTVAAWDPISSSAPSLHTSTSENATVEPRHTRCPSIISIGDSSEASSESEFPIFDSLGLSQPRSSRLDPTCTYTAVATSRTKPVEKNTKTRQSEPRPKVDAAERAAAKSQQKEERRREKEREKQERQRQKDVAAATIEVNKAKANRKFSAKEMIVDLPLSLCPTTKVQLQTLLDGLEIEHTEYQSQVENVVKWRRKIKSQFDEESGQWIPTPLRIEQEQHALVIMTAEELVRLAVRQEIDEHVERFRRHFPRAKLIYMLQGMLIWKRKNRLVRNRKFAAEARSHGNVEQASGRSGRAREDSAVPIDENVVEDAMMWLQVEYDVLIHHTALPLETAQWIFTLTQGISTIPYRRQREQDTAGARFCMESGQVRTGSGAADTYVRMLQEMLRVTAPVAHGVASEFGSVARLVERLEAGGPTALEQVARSASRDGAVSDRMVGPALSRRFFKVFTGTDEMSTDV